MSEENLPIEYKVELELANGAGLDMLMFSHDEHRWIFRHRFVHPPEGERLEMPKLINDTVLVVNYAGGVAQNCNLSMDMIRPDKRGKRYLYGVDISEGSHLFVEFAYEKKDDLFRMKTADIGVHNHVDLDCLGEGLVKPVDFPFPLKDLVENEFGVYKIPFLRRMGEQAFFEFPDDYRK